MTLEEKLLNVKRLERSDLVKLALDQWTRAQDLVIENEVLRDAAGRDAQRTKDERERAERYHETANLATGVAIALAVALVISAIVTNHYWGLCHG